MINEHYYKRRYFDSHNNEQVQLFPNDQRPNLEQFYYHVRTILIKKGYDPDRIGISKIEYKKDLAGRSGTAPVPTGPGEVYQLDATQHDLNLVSPLCEWRALRIGRITAYKVIDCFSGMGVGLHLSLAPPSWAQARLAIFNACRDKVEYCQELGIKITPEEWPVKGVPQIICVDNAELQNEISTPGIKDLGYAVRFARALRGDDKGLVEKAIDLMNTEAESVPGFVRNKTRRRRQRDPLLDAVLTPRDLYRLLIMATLHRNNEAGIAEDYLNTAMAEDGVQAIPREIWRWGEKYRPGMRKKLRDETIYLKLLEKGTASVRREGVYFKKRWYRCAWTLENGYQDQKSKGNKAPQFEVRFLRHSANYILLDTHEGLQVAHLSNRSRRFFDSFEEEIEQRLDLEQQHRNQRSAAELESRIGVDLFTERLVKKAKSEQRWLADSEIRRQHITAQRQDALAYENAEEAKRFESMVKDRYVTQSHPVSESQENDDDTTDPTDADFETAMSTIHSGGHHENGS